MKTYEDGVEDSARKADEHAAAHEKFAKTLRPEDVEAHEAIVRDIRALAFKIRMLKR